MATLKIKYKFPKDTIVSGREELEKEIRGLEDKGWTVRKKIVKSTRLEYHLKKEDN